MAAEHGSRRGESRKSEEAEQVSKPTTVTDSRAGADEPPIARKNEKLRTVNQAGNLRGEHRGVELRGLRGRVAQRGVGRGLLPLRRLDLFFVLQTNILCNSM